jgi:pimeloyl-ACP methyl ester carboxylesterase
MLIAALKLLFVILVFFCVFLPCFYSFGNVYRPKRPILGTPQDDGFKYDPVSISTSDGELIRGWFLFGAKGSPLIVVCHGVGTNREDLRGVSRFLCRAGFNVLAFDFRAHGESTGAKTTFGFRESLDVQAAVQYAGAHYQQQFEGIGIYAISMGSAAAIIAARHMPQVKAFVFDSPFARLEGLVDQQFSHWSQPPRRLLASLAKFYGWLFTGISATEIAPEDYAPDLGMRPVLVFHGDRDTLVPIAQGRQLFEKIPGPKEFVETPGATHVQSYAVMGRAYEEKVVDFFRHHLGPAGGPVRAEGQP